MMLIGTSFGKCLRSLAAGEVDVNDVLIIVTRTMCRDLAQLLETVEFYRKEGMPAAYDVSQFDLDDLKDIATELWHQGKIHQPRNYNGSTAFVHVELSKLETWIPLAPSPKTDDPRVVDAYERYLVMRNLLQ